MPPNQPSDESVDAVALAAEARSQRKSLGRLSSLVSRSVPVVWRAGRGLFVLVLLLQVVAAVALGAQVLVIQVVLDRALGLVAGSAVDPLIGPVVVLALLTALAAISRSIQVHVQRLLGERVAYEVLGDVLDAANGVDLRSFEDPQFYNRLARVQMSALTRPYQVSQGLITATGAAIGGISVGVALGSINAWLLPLVVLGGLPILAAGRRESRLEFAFTVSQSARQRLRVYLAAIQGSRDEAKEIRAFAAAPWLRSRLDAHTTHYLTDLTAHLKRRALLGSVGHIGSALVLIVTLGVLARLVVAGTVTVSEAGAAIVGVRMLAGQVQVAMTGIQGVFESGLFLDDLAEFLDIGARARAADTGEPAPDAVGLVSAEGIGFTYPGGGTPALAGASIEMRAGEVVALVGENGSGKTTLAKVLAGLYPPDAGSVTWDGVDIRRYSPSAVRERVTVIFQDFVRYAMSAEDNITLGDVTTPADRERIRSAARDAGVARSLEALPHGYETLLTRMFPGGSDLSGGQWQRVALARAFYRDSPLVILDEPSASLDPRAEHELFGRLRGVLGGRAALFISHRFAAVRGADRIYVLSAGTVVEHGTHDELLARGGLYSDLYRMQAEVSVAGTSGQGVGSVGPVPDDA